MSTATLANCTKCDKHTYVMPLHDDKGGPLMCPICAGKWHAEHSRRRKWGRIIIKAMKMYEREGGRWSDFDKLKLAASGFCRDYGIDLLGYGSADTIGSEVPDITTELLADTVQLTHPDKHPKERRELAHRVTQDLLALKPFIFPEPKPEPVKPYKPHDSSFKSPRVTSNKPSQPSYPCEACADSVPYYYCDPCRAEYNKRNREEQERINARQRAWYASRNHWRKNVEKPCEGCGEQFKGKRKDTKYCSPACRQHAHRKRNQRASEGSDGQPNVTNKNNRTAQHLNTRNARTGEVRL